MASERVRGRAEGGQAASDSVRCPYCHDALTSDESVTACAACGASHHLSCFSGHGGCAVHACGGTRGLTTRGTRPAVLGAQATCAACKGGFELHELVAACTCGRLLHGPCFEALRQCGGAACRGGVELVGVGDLLVRRRTNERRACVIFGVLAWIGAAVAAALALANPPQDRAPAVIYALMGVAVGIWLRFSARRAGRDLRALREAAAPRREPRPPKGDLEEPPRT